MSFRRRKQSDSQRKAMFANMGTTKKKKGRIRKIPSIVRRKKSRQKVSLDKDSKDHVLKNLKSTAAIFKNLSKNEKDKVLKGRAKDLQKKHEKIAKKVKKGQRLNAFERADVIQSLSDNQGLSNKDKRVIRKLGR